MSSEIKLSQSSNTHPSAHAPGTCTLIFSSCACFTVYPQLHHVTASHPSPCDNPSQRGRAFRKNEAPSKNGRIQLNYLHKHHGSPLLHIHQSVGDQFKRMQGQGKMAAFNSIIYIYRRTLHSFLYFAYCQAASTVILLLQKSTFTPSI